MKVILNQTVPKVGKAGAVVTVADGYARNFLFPRGLAVVADRRQIAALEKKRAYTEMKAQGQKAEAEALKLRLDGQTLRIEGKVGADGLRLFGAVTSARIAEALKASFGIELDTRQIALVEPIKRLGTYPVELDLSTSVDAAITVVVFDPAAPVEEEDESEAELATA